LRGTAATNVDEIPSLRATEERTAARLSDSPSMAAVATAFGTLPPNSNPAGLGTFTYNPRLPGQLYDAETGQFYNINRNLSAIPAAVASGDGTCHK
jgi:hypothetical protein